MKSELKENAQELTVMGWKLGIKSTFWTRRKKLTFNQNRMRKQELKKMRRDLGNLQDFFKCSNIRIIGVPEREQEEQKIENFKDNVPNLANETDF